jgi:hypothetical protein
VYRHGSEIRRAVNDEIVKLAYATAPLRADERWIFLCECDNTQCHRQEPLTLEEFDAARLSDDAIIASAHAPVLLHKAGRRAETTARA